MDKHKRKNSRKKHRDSSIKNDKKNIIKEAREEVEEIMEENIVNNNFINKIMDKDEKESKLINDNTKDYIKLQKNNKTLIAIVILLVGIAGGSFFVDIAQLFSQKGFSARALKDAQVVEYNGNTWVRYDDPKITVDVFDADDCKDCVTDEVLVKLRSLIPTLEAHRIDVKTEEGKELAKKDNIKHIPAFVFSKEIKDSDFYQEAAILFEEAPNNTYFFKASSVGVPVGEYLEEPSINNAISLGNENAKVTILAYTDFTCKMCSVAAPIIEKIKNEYKDDIRLVIKPIPSPQQQNAFDIAIAAECANEQNKFNEYTKLLFDNQKTLINSKNVTELLNKYASRIKLNKDEFTKCLIDENNKKKLEQNQKEASEFAVVGTPTLFINGQPYSGMITYENLKSQIESFINPKGNIEK